MNIITNNTVSYDEYNSLGYTYDLDNPLTEFQTELIHRTFTNAEILNAAYTRNEWLPCPIRIKLRSAAEPFVKTVYLRMTRHYNGILNEAYVLPLLREFGLNVPKMYCSPVTDPNLPQLGEMILISEVAGENIYNYFDLKKPENGDAASKIILECVQTLYSLTDKMIASGADRILPVATLADELSAIKSRGGEWFTHQTFIQTFEYLERIIPSIDDGFVFSNGDINPCNFLYSSSNLSSYGFIDFSHARFHDPLYGFATYITYDMKPFNLNGLIDGYLKFSEKTWNDFRPRLLLRALWTLQRELKLNDDNNYSRMLLDIIS